MHVYQLMIHMNVALHLVHVLMKYVMNLINVYRVFHVLISIHVIIVMVPQYVVRTVIRMQVHVLPNVLV